MHSSDHRLIPWRCHQLVLGNVWRKCYQTLNRTRMLSYYRMAFHRRKLVTEFLSLLRLIASCLHTLQSSKSHPSHFESNLSLYLVRFPCALFKATHLCQGILPWFFLNWTCCSRFSRMATLTAPCLWTIRRIRSWRTSKVIYLVGSLLCTFSIFISGRRQQLLLLAQLQLPRVPFEFSRKLRCLTTWD